MEENICCALYIRLATNDAPIPLLRNWYQY